MAGRGIKRNFTGGEVAPTINSRDDLAKYQSSCQVMYNFITQLHGGGRFRGGFRYIDSALGNGVFLPFEFNTDEEDIYLLVFTDQKLRIVQDEGYVLDTGTPVELNTPYALTDLPGLWLGFCQSGDVIYLVHPNYASYILARTSHTSWSLEAISFASSQDPPTSPSAAWHGASSGSFTQRYKITAVSSGGEESLPTAEASVTNAYPPTEWSAGDYITLSWTGASGAQEYNIYKESGGYFGFIGISTGTSFRDDNFEAITSLTPPIENNPFTGGNNPAVAAIHQQRLWMAGSKDNPYTMYASQTGDYVNFNKSRPLKDDDALELPLASGKINQIKWMMPFGDLLIGTAGAEFKVSGTETDAITPVSRQAKSQSYWGSGDIRPLVVGSSILHVQRQASRVRDLFYSFELDGYTGNDLTVLANHLFDGHSIVCWAYQQEPDSVIWAVRDDGILLGMTYLKEHEIWGWHRHETDGSFKWVATVTGNPEDRLYALIERTVNGSPVYYIEKLSPKWRAAEGIENAFYVDSGLTYDGWNTAPANLMALSGGSAWEAGESLTLSASGGHTPFSSVSVNRSYRLRSGKDTVTVRVTEYTSDTVVTAVPDGNVPLSLRSTATGDWAEMATIISGLPHLEGKSVVALADGSAVSEMTVSGGEIELPFAAAKAHIGLSYMGILAPLPFEFDTEAGTTQGYEKGFGQIEIQLHESVGGKAASGAADTDPYELTYDVLQDIPQVWGEPLVPYTGGKMVSSTGGIDDELTIFVAQDLPLPLNVLSIIADVDIGG